MEPDGGAAGCGGSGHYWAVDSSRIQEPSLRHFRLSYQVHLYPVKYHIRSLLVRQIFCHISIPLILCLPPLPHVPCFPALAASYRMSAEKGGVGVTKQHNCGMFCYSFVSQTKWPPPLSTIKWDNRWPKSEVQRMRNIHLTTSHHNTHSAVGTWWWVSCDAWVRAGT